MKVLMNILSTRGVLEQGACLDALISIMLDSSANQMVQLSVSRYLVIFKFGGPLGFPKQMKLWVSSSCSDRISKRVMVSRKLQSLSETNKLMKISGLFLSELIIAVDCWLLFKFLFAILQQYIWIFRRQETI